MLLRARRKQALPDHIEIDTGDARLRIRLRSNPRARRYLLRMPADYSGPILTIPKGGDLARAERFARQHIDWLLERMTSRQDHVALQPGDRVPLRGVDHVILPTGKLRGLVESRSGSEGPELLVPGSDDHIPRKLVTWLKAQAKDDLHKAVDFHAGRLGEDYTGITVRDTKSRWGSCASNGRLSFSWRLILAPPEILDYVAAHEVAHLREMNHSDRFWKLCHELAPHTPDARRWLKEHGARLHGYG
ncbi:M48 family metallopeptidase [Roseibium sp.]|uniref:M48 family metallopeptidase n=1 Tax=Roseibium sp. TaxID=1936156 RepID=UPI003A97C35F